MRHNPNPAIPHSGNNNANPAAIELGPLVGATCASNPDASMVRIELAALFWGIKEFGSRPQAGIGEGSGD